MPGRMRGLGTHCFFQDATSRLWKRCERGTGKTGQGVRARLEGVL